MNAEWANNDVLTQSETTGLNSKAVLVINEMPKSCCYCQFYCSDFIDRRDYCSLDEHKEIDYHGRPDWCPLRLLPRKLTEADISWGEQRGYRGGWNNCLAEITGETE